MIDTIPTKTGYCEQCAAHPVPVATLGHDEPVNICRECLQDAISALDQTSGAGPDEDPAPPFFGDPQKLASQGA